jgi:GntR family transcriptional regulator/MocR family aminotransferase
LDIVIELPDDPGRPAYQRLAEAIRESILGGRFRPGERLPPTRVLATNLSLARNTVLEAYEQLIAEGYLSARHGSGTYVAPDLPDRAFRAESFASNVARDGKGSPPRLSDFAERLLAEGVPTVIDDETGQAANFEFRYGTPSSMNSPSTPGER